MFTKSCGTAAGHGLLGDRLRRAMTSPYTFTRCSYGIKYIIYYTLHTIPSPPQQQQQQQQHRMNHKRHERERWKNDRCLHHVKHKNPQLTSLSFSDSVSEHNVYYKRGFFSIFFSFLFTLPVDRFSFVYNFVLLIAVVAAATFSRRLSAICISIIYILYRHHGQYNQKCKKTNYI